MDIHLGQERIVTTEFNHDGTVFPVGTEFSIAVWQREGETWRCGCKFEAEYSPDMHSLQHVNDEGVMVHGCDDYQGWWIYYRIVLENSEPLVPAVPTWEV